jgi:hypothetical protein
MTVEIPLWLVQVGFSVVALFALAILGVMFIVFLRVF